MSRNIDAGMRNDRVDQIRNERISDTTISDGVVHDYAHIHHDTYNKNR